jgi:3-phosphoglycerate kinase
VTTRTADALVNINKLLNNKEENSLAKSLDDAREMMFSVAYGKKDRSELKYIVDLIDEARHIILQVGINLAWCNNQEPDVGEAFSHNLNAAWQNVNMIMKGYTDYEKYNRLN